MDLITELLDTQRQCLKELKNIGMSLDSLLMMYKQPTPFIGAKPIVQHNSKNLELLRYTVAKVKEESKTLKQV